MRALTLLLTFSVLAVPALATASEPSLDEIIQRHLEAVGGAERLGALRTLKKTGTYAYNGHEHPLVSHHATDRRCREEIEGLRLWGSSVWEGHTVLRGTNGTVAWAVDESRDEAMRRISPANAASIIDEADLPGALFEHEKKGHRVRLEGR